MTGQGLRNLILVLLGLMVLWGLGLVVASRLARWPFMRAAFQRLGEAAQTFALGLLGLVIVVIVLRALGWIPPN